MIHDQILTLEFNIAKRKEYSIRRLSNEYSLFNGSCGSHFKLNQTFEVAA